MFVVEFIFSWIGDILQAKINHIFSQVVFFFADVQLSWKF